MAFENAKSTGFTALEVSWNTHLIGLNVSGAANVTRQAINAINKTDIATSKAVGSAVG